jgi:hypothetical protein
MSEDMMKLEADGKGMVDLYFNDYWGLAITLGKINNSYVAQPDPTPESTSHESNSV